MSVHFSTKPLSGDLKRLSVRGGAATFAGQGVKFVLNLGSVMVLARILTPQDFGLIAMVTALTGFIMIFKDLGLSMATVQRAEINHGQISTLFWINVALSVLLMLITLALAPAVAWFYQDPRLAAVTAALSSAFLFSGLTVQHQALLSRQMRLSAVMIIDVLSMIVGILTAMLCAWTGLGYWALVWMQIATAAAHAVGVWIACGWIPGRPVRHSGVRSMTAFGGYLTGFNFVNYFARNLDNILIGRFCGAESLGLYSRAYSLLLFPIGQITAPISAVAVPALSRLQKEPERYRRFYLKAIKLIAYISMPLVAAMGTLSMEIVQLILGNVWLDAAPIFMVLAFAAIWQPVGSTVGWIFVSGGQTRRMFAWVCLAAPLIVLSFIIGLPWGAIGVATGYAVCNLLLVIPGFSFALKGSPISVRDVVAVLYRPLAMSVIIALTMTVARRGVVEYSPLLIATICLSIGVITFLVMARAVKPVWLDLQDLWDIRRILFSKPAIA